MASGAMTAYAPLPEPRDVLIERARVEMQLAAAEPLANRARVHVQAAETWLRLASRRPKIGLAHPAGATSEDHDAQQHGAVDGVAKVSA
jgi:hypothetical protein